MLTFFINSHLRVFLAYSCFKIWDFLLGIIGYLVIFPEQSYLSNLAAVFIIYNTILMSLIDISHASLKHVIP